MVFCHQDCGPQGTEGTKACNGRENPFTIEAPHHFDTPIYKEQATMEQQRVITDLRPDDVIMGRGTGPNEFGGNVRYRDLVRAVLSRHAGILLDATDDDHEATAAPLSSNGGGQSATSTSSAATRSTNAVSSQDDEKFPSNRSFSKMKTDLATEIVQTIKARNGRFLQQITGSNTRRRKSGDHPSRSGKSASRGGQRLYTEVDDFVAIDKTKQTFRHQLKVLAGIKKPPPRPPKDGGLVGNDSLNSIMAAVGKNTYSSIKDSTTKTTSVVSQGSYNTTTKGDHQDAATISSSMIHSPRGRKTKFSPSNDRRQTSTARLLGVANNSTGHDTGLLLDTRHVQGGQASTGGRRDESSEQHATSFVLPQHSTGLSSHSIGGAVAGSSVEAMIRTALMSQSTTPSDALSSLLNSSVHQQLVTTILLQLRQQQEIEQEQQRRQQQQLLEQDILRQILASSSAAMGQQQLASTEGTNPLLVQLLLNTAGGASSDLGNLSVGLLSSHTALLSLIGSMQLPAGAPQAPSLLVAALGQHQQDDRQQGQQQEQLAELLRDLRRF